MFYSLYIIGYMAEQAIEKKKDLKPINGKTFAKYRNIYKEYLKSFTVQEIAEQQKCSRQYVREALSYMARYNEMMKGVKT